MNHRLYIIEGLPCSGKSTTSAYIAELLKQQGNVCYVDKGTGDYPADYAFHALAPTGMLSDKSQIVSHKDYSGELFDQLLQFKSCDFLPWETEKPVMLKNGGSSPGMCRRTRPMFSTAFCYKTLCARL